MSEESLTSVMKKVREARKEMWIKEPEEIKRLRERKGFTGTVENSFGTHIQAHGMVTSAGDSLWCLRNAAKSGLANVDSLKAVTKPFLDLWIALWTGWYGFERTATLLKNVEIALEEVKTKEEYISLVQETMLYVHRLGWWIDSVIPYYKLSLFYEWIKGEQKE